MISSGRKLNRSARPHAAGVGVDPSGAVFSVVCRTVTGCPLLTEMCLHTQKFGRFAKIRTAQFCVPLKALPQTLVMGS